MKKLNQKGFGVLEILLIISTLIIVGYIGYKYIYKPTIEKTPGEIAKQSLDNIIDNSESFKHKPQALTTGILFDMRTDKENDLEQKLTPTFKSYRQSNLAKPPCNGSTYNINLPSKKYLALVCNSLLDPAILLGVELDGYSNYIFRDGTKGVSVDYQVKQSGADPGTTYFSFKLVPDNDYWLMSDYFEVFVPEGSNKPDLTGFRETSS